MFAGFFLELRQAKVPVSLREYLTLMEAMRRNLAEYSVEDFYYLSRATLVKDERNLDKFDRVFGHHFKGIETIGDAGMEIPEEWLRKLTEKVLTEEEKQLIESLGGQYIAVRWTDVIIFSLLVLVLVLRPTGLLGRAAPTKS